MRWLVLLLAIWVGALNASDQERLQIEVIVLKVFDSANTVAFGDLGPDLTGIPDRDSRQAQVLGDVHWALDVLKVGPGNYLAMSEWPNEIIHMLTLVCQKATLHHEQSCWSWTRNEPITDWRNFIYDAYDREPASAGMVRLHVLDLPEDFPWGGLVGTAWRARWGPATNQRWNTSSCVAWAVNDPTVIAHELGHCFGLVHNEDDLGDSDLDLMYKSANSGTFGTWLKESNINKVRQFFGVPVLLPVEALEARPTVEMHY